MVSLLKISYLPLNYVTSESKPFEAKGLALLKKKIALKLHYNLQLIKLHITEIVSK